MADPIQRVHYFDHQFLHAADFIDEQQYHIRLRRLHNAALHTWGIARGLDLSFKTGESRATVSEGVAVDGNGREIVLAGSRLTPDLSGHKNEAVYITIAYSEKETDSTTETGVRGERRVTEEPEIRVAENPPVDPSQELILGRLTLDKDAKITRKDEGEEPNTRCLAGVIGGDLEARRLRLSLPDAASSQWPALSCSAASQVDLTGSLIVTGNVGIGTKPNSQSQLTVKGASSLEGALSVTEAADLKGGLTVTGNVGIGTTEPKSPLSVSGGAAIGSGYADKRAPDNGLLVEGNVGIGKTSPEVALDVTGTLRADVATVGKDALPVVVSAESGECLRIIRGSVNANATIAAGRGFKVSRDAKENRYLVDFGPAFSDKPVVVAASNVERSLTRLETCLVEGVDKTGCRIFCFDVHSLAPIEGPFQFVAVGPI
jgi:hypothetical protein